MNVHSQQRFKQTLCPGLYTRAPCPTLVLNITAPSLRVSVCYLSKLDISLGVSPASQSEAGETWTMNMPCSGLAMNPKEEGAVSSWSSPCLWGRWRSDPASLDLQGSHGWASGVSR